MAVSISKRTLSGFSGKPSNVIYMNRLLTLMEKPDKLAARIKNPRTWNKKGRTMKFNAIVGNPPYHSDTGGGSETAAASQATPIYQLFVQQAEQLEPEYISMIIPAKWYNGGMGLGDFRLEMLHDRHISKLVDFSNSRELFPTVNIGGGICYFLWDTNEKSGTDVINVLSGSRSLLHRSLDQFETFFVRSNIAISIIDKVRRKTDHFVSEMASSIDTFGIPSKEKGHEDYREGDVLLLHSVGSNGQGTSYLEAEKVQKNRELIDKYKIKISILVPQNGEVGVNPENGYRSISSPQILYPGTVDTFSYLNIGFFETEEEAVNFRNYMTCKFPRFMMRTTYSSAHISKVNFIFVPTMDFKKEWSDEELYHYFELSEEEIDIVEKTMRPLVLEENDIGADFADELFKKQ
jgi:hypothetical protein